MVPRGRYTWIYTGLSGIKSGNSSVVTVRYCNMSQEAPPLWR